MVAGRIIGGTANPFVHGFGDEIDAIRYIDPVTPDQPPAYPSNPNGSQGDIAGLCDITGRVLGLMPHPERHVVPTQHPRWTRLGLAAEGEGLALFRNAVRYFA